MIKGLGEICNLEHVDYRVVLMSVKSNPTALGSNQ